MSSHAVRGPVLSAVARSQDLTALVKLYEHDDNGRAVYIHVPCVLETEFYGSSGMSTCSALARELPREIRSFFFLCRYASSLGAIRQNASQ